MSISSVVARVLGAAVIYAIALAAAVFLACRATQFSCHLSPDGNVVTAFAVAALTFFATGLVVMGGVLIPAAMFLRRIGWLYWWSVLPIAAASAALPSAVLCAVDGGSCSQSGFAPLVGTLVFAGLCGGVFLWWSWLRHEASQPKLMQRLAAQSPAVKLGLIFLGAYFAVLAAAAVFVAGSGGEAGMIFLYIALPWPSVGSKLFGHLGTGYGGALGLALNAVIAFSIGYGIARIFRRP